jgi:hypothetical protein
MYRYHIEKQIGDLDLTEVKRTHVQELISLLPPQTSQMTLAVLKSIYREALAQELVENSPAHGVKGQRVIVAPKRFLTWDEVDKESFGKYTTRFVFSHFMDGDGAKQSHLLKTIFAMVVSMSINQYMAQLRAEPVFALLHLFRHLRNFPPPGDRYEKTSNLMASLSTL